MRAAGGAASVRGSLLMPSATRTPVPADDSTANEREPIRPTLARRLKWRAELAGYWVIEFGLGLLPLAWVTGAGRWAGAVAHAGLKRRRRTVGRNLRIAFAGEKTPAELREMTREVFCRAGANLLGALRTAAMGERSLAGALLVRDEPVYREAAARGKGVVMVLAHMGNWEALAQWFPKLLPAGTEGATVYRPLNNPLMNARVTAARARRGVKLFSKDDSPLAMAGFLRRGGVLGVLADQRAGEHGELVPFFGRNASCTPIPSILARRTGAAIVGISLRTVAAGRWELRFHGLETGEPTTAGVMGLVERMMRESPEDVFWLQDRWRANRGQPAKVSGRTPRGGALVPAKRRRALLWVDEAGAVPSAPVASPEDVDYFTMERVAGEAAEAYLLRVDAAAALPLDFVVGGTDDAELREACRSLGIGLMKGRKA